MVNLVYVFNVNSGGQEFQEARRAGGQGCRSSGGQESAGRQFKGVGEMSARGSSSSRDRSLGGQGFRRLGVQEVKNGPGGVQVGSRS